MSSSKNDGINENKTQSSRKMRYFQEVLEKSGVSLQFSDKPNLFLKESSLIIRDVRNEIEKHENYPNNIPEFINGLRQLVKKKKYFEKALTASSDGSDIFSPKAKQHECLFRIFLNVDCIQSEVISFLLEQATVHVLNKEDTISLRLLLGPLRYLSFIKETNKVAQQLLDLLEISTKAAKLEILSHIPEIIPDSEYQFIAHKLVDILNENITLTPAIIDCLNFFILNATTKAEIQDRITSTLNTTCTLKTFPIIFRFLISDNSKTQNLDTVLLNRMRSALDVALSSLKNNDPEHETNLVLVFHELHKYANDRIVNSWFNVVSTRNANYEPVDLLLIFMIHTLDATRRKQYENLVKKKISAGFLTSDTIKRTIESYLGSKMFIEYLNSIVAIGSSMLTQKNIDVARVTFSGVFFHKYADFTSRKQVLDYLTDWTSGEPSSALKILMSFVDEEDGVVVLRPHIPHLMCLLEKLDNLELYEVGLVFELLTALNEDSVSDNLHIVTRKQLHSYKNVERFRGIVAAVSVATYLARASTNSSVTGYKSLVFNDIIVVTLLKITPFSYYKKKFVTFYLYNVIF